MSLRPLQEDFSMLRRERLAWVLFIAALVVYTVTRLVRIEAFPIYFFCDEPMPVVQFRELMTNGWRATEAPHEFLPAYFRNAQVFNLSLSVYLQGLASLIGGNTVATVRVTFALLSLTGAVALGLILRRAFRVQDWWSGVAFLTIIPCWFLHSRTGFESSLMVTCYTWFLYAYLRYRDGNPQWIFATAVAGAATFYSYAPGQGIVFATGLLLLVSDARYHWKQRGAVIPGLLIGALLFLPYLRFRWDHPEMVGRHLGDLNSYLVQPLSLSEKAGLFFHNYLDGFSPRFWFAQDGDDALRHLVPDHGHLDLLMVPFVLLGLAVCFYRWRNPLYRVVLVAALAAPFSGALVAPTVTRMLTLVVPFALCAALGFCQLMTWIKSTRLACVVRLASFGLFAVTGFGLLVGSLASAPTATRNYGLYGLQWGAPEVFRDLIPKYLKSEPAANLVISHLTWNWPMVYPEFFGWQNERRVTFASFQQIYNGDVLPEPKDLVLLTAEEFAAIGAHPEVQRFAVLETITLPDGNPGYYWGHLFLDPQWIDGLRAQRPKRDIQPRWDRVLVGGFPCAVGGSGIASGRVSGLLGAGAGNVVSESGTPINLEFFFDEPVSLGEFKIDSDPGNPPLTIWGTRASQTLYTHGFLGAEAFKDAMLPAIAVDHLRIEIGARTGKSTTLRRIQINPAAELPPGTVR